MTSKDFNTDDLVWARMKNYPFWPAKITEPPADTKAKRDSHYVFFFGSNNCAWISDENIVHHSDEQVQSCSNKKKSVSFQNAIDTIVEAYKIRLKKSQTQEKNEKDEREFPKKSSPQITNNFEKKVVKVVKSSTISPKNEERAQKKRKLQSIDDDAEVDHYPLPPNKKQKKNNFFEHNIVHHSFEEVQSCNNKKKSVSFQSAIDAIAEEHKIGLKKHQPLAKEKNDKGERELPKKYSPPIPNNLGKKVGKVVKNSTLSPKKEERSPKKRKLQSTYETGVNHYSSFPSKKQKKYFLERNFCSSYTGVPVVLSPDSPIPLTSGILARTTEYVDLVPTHNVDLNDVRCSLLEKNIKATTKKIGFLGLGMMGQRMVKNLLNSNHHVTIWNRTPEKCHDFVNAGAHLALTPADVISNCDITFCCVSDPLAVKSLVFGNCGILKGLDGCEIGNKGYVEMTAIDPLLSIEIAEAISSKGAKYLEAPVNGSRQLADEGALLIIGAGDRQLFNECQTCFCALSKNAYYLSCDIGSGFKMSIILSALMGTTCAALAEAMALIERTKLSQSNFLDILRMGRLNCEYLHEKGQCMVVRNFKTNIAIKHQQKDLNMALAIGHSYEQPMLITAAANELYKHAKLLRYSDHDISAVLLGAKY